MIHIYIYIYLPVISYKGWSKTSPRFSSLGGFERLGNIRKSLMLNGAASTSGAVCNNALQLGMAQAGFAAGLIMPGGTQRHVSFIANCVSVCRRYPGSLPEPESAL